MSEIQNYRLTAKLKFITEIDLTVALGIKDCNINQYSQTRLLYTNLL